MKVFVSTYPFGLSDPTPLHHLINNGIEYELNPYKRKITSEELKEHIADIDILIAGTEKLNGDIFKAAPKLKLIARVGIGIDNIDFKETQKRNIIVTYTPDAVSNAVAELTIGNIINLARQTCYIDQQIKMGNWYRPIGFEIKNRKIGIIGFGRVGKLVAKKIHQFECELLVNDICPDDEIGSKYGAKFVSKDQIIENCDIISLHVPITPLTDNMFSINELKRMKPTACLINTSRGSIVNENDLYEALKEKIIAGAAIDVYDVEPYIAGRLCNLSNTILTSHSGSCSIEARLGMELGAAQEAVRFAKGIDLVNLVPKETIVAERSEIAIPINSDWHEISNDFPSNTDSRYQLYRRRWGQYPTHNIIGPYPLNVDVEVVRQDDNNIKYIYEYVSRHECSQINFMDVDLFKKIIEDIDNFSEPVAIKIGFRGDPFLHPKISTLLQILQSTNNIVETIITTSTEHLSSIDSSLLIGKKPVTLNIFSPFLYPGHKEFESNHSVIEKLCILLEKIRRERIIADLQYPQIRITTVTEDIESFSIEKFKKFWKNWADVTAITDIVKNPIDRFHKSRTWACSKLWQRLQITYDGKILICNYDMKEKQILGNFKKEAIQLSWNSEIMTNIREMHLEGKSEFVSPCNDCYFRLSEINK